MDILRITFQHGTGHAWKRKYNNMQAVFTLTRYSNSGSELQKNVRSTVYYGQDTEGFRQTLRALH